MGLSLIALLTGIKIAVGITHYRSLFGINCVVIRGHSQVTLAHFTIMGIPMTFPITPLPVTLMRTHDVDVKVGLWTKKFRNLRSTFSSSRPVIPPIVMIGCWEFGTANKLRSSLRIRSSLKFNDFNSSWVVIASIIINSQVSHKNYTAEWFVSSSQFVPSSKSRRKGNSKKLHRNLTKFSQVLLLFKEIWSVWQMKHLFLDDIFIRKCAEWRQQVFSLFNSSPVSPVHAPELSSYEIC